VEAAVKRKAHPARFRTRRLLAVFGWLSLIVAALAFVVWRQSVGVVREAELRALQTERAIAEAERLELVRRIETASSRARIVRVARERLGMHLPSDAEILLLPEPSGVPAVAAGR
jgi:cell division protein FtsL